MIPVKIDETALEFEIAYGANAQSCIEVKIDETALEFEKRKKEVEDFAESLNKWQNQINERSELLDEREKTLLKRKQEIETMALQDKFRLFDEFKSKLQETLIHEFKNIDDELEVLQQKGIEKLNQQFVMLIDVADAKRDALTKLQCELQEMLTLIKNLDNELETQRQKGLDELNQELIAKVEAVEKKHEALDQEQKTLSEEKTHLECERKNLEFDKIRLKKLEETLKHRQAGIESEIENKLDARHKILEETLKAKAEHEKKLLDKLKEYEAELANFQDFRTVYGDTPEILKNKIQNLKDRNLALVKELGSRPGEELQADFERLESENKCLKQELVDNNKQLSAMQEQFVELQTLRQENTILQAAKENLKGTLDEAYETIDGLQARIARLTAAEITPADWDKRASSLREPYLPNPFNAPKLESEEVERTYWKQFCNFINCNAPKLELDKVAVGEYSEIGWLEGIKALFEDYGITFHERILYAFHTSFKIANWSTLTVLAGVSGTGKSELPRLYSAFGGFNFITVPVQPNWDSQESMLGFFNSIDNKFDAQPVLRFLVECTDKDKYENNMAIVLLDEMNLAHVEHYFADFLSKLETRRSLEGNVPEIYVNLGAGVKPYGLPLKRNILWCGTMNQDETTKSLSDKVLDRGIVINFPRPRELKSRKGALSLESFCKDRHIFPMNIELWNSWREKSIKLEEKQLEELENYRHLLEKMNEHLSYAGRAIGHRVWQSIEHYVINYPTVRAAVRNAGSELTDELQKTMHTAVEDQIVQKVMPKLRGIETRGNSYEKCLKPIKGLLNDKGFHLNDDFDRACSMGYGQFMWNSAEYISNDT